MLRGNALHKVNSYHMQVVMENVNSDQRFYFDLAMEPTKRS